MTEDERQWLATELLRSLTPIQHRIVYWVRNAAAGTWNGWGHQTLLLSALTVKQIEALWDISPELLICRDADCPPVSVDPLMSN